MGIEGIINFFQFVTVEHFQDCRISLPYLRNVGIEFGEKPWPYGLIWLFCPEPSYFGFLENVVTREHFVGPFPGNDYLEVVLPYKS